MYVSRREAIALELQKDEEDPNNVVDAIKGLLTNIANVETANDRLEGSNDVVIVQYVEGKNENIAICHNLFVIGCVIYASSAFM